MKFNPKLINSPLDAADELLEGLHAIASYQPQGNGHAHGTDR